RSTRSPTLRLPASPTLRLRASATLTPAAPPPTPAAPPLPTPPPQRRASSAPSSVPLSPAPAPARRPARAQPAAVPITLTPAPEIIPLSTFGGLARFNESGVLPHLLGRAPLSLTGATRSRADLVAAATRYLSGQLDRRVVGSALWLM